MKRTITKPEEFEIMKLVLDKFLWVGILIMGYGFYRIISFNESIWYGMAVIVSGALLMLLFTWILIKEFNYVKR